MHTTTNTTATATFTISTTTISIVPTTTPITTTCKVTIAMANCIMLSSYTTAVTTITTMPKGVKVKFSENICENFSCTENNLPFVCRLSKGHLSNIPGTVSCVKLKLTIIVVGDVELTKRKYLHHNTSASTPTSTTTAIIIITATTATATKAETPNINSTQNATIITTDAATTTDKPKDIKANILGNIVTVLK